MIRFSQNLLKNPQHLSKNMTNSQIASPVIWDEPHHEAVARARRRAADEKRRQARRMRGATLPTEVKVRDPGTKL